MFLRSARFLVGNEVSVLRESVRDDEYTVVYGLCHWRKTRHCRGRPRAQLLGRRMGMGYRVSYDGEGAMLVLRLQQGAFWAYSIEIRNTAGVWSFAGEYGSSFAKEGRLSKRWIGFRCLDRLEKIQHYAE